MYLQLPIGPKCLFAIIRNMFHVWWLKEYCFDGAVLQVMLDDRSRKNICNFASGDFFLMLDLYVIFVFIPSPVREVYIFYTD